MRISRVSRLSSGSIHTALGNDTTGFSKTGWFFYGWNTASDGSGDSYRPGDTFTDTGSVILYAIYTNGSSASIPFAIYTAEDLTAVGSDSGDYTG